MWRGYMYAALMISIIVVRAVVSNQAFIRKQVISLRVRSAITAAIYRKVFALQNIFHPQHGLLLYDAFF